MKERAWRNDHAPLPKMRDRTGFKNNRVGKLSRMPELSEVRGSGLYSEVSAGRVSAREGGLEETVLQTGVCKHDAILRFGFEMK